jgi:pantoate--beta-alanine ligase
MRTRITDAPSRLDSPADLRRWSLRCHAAGMSVGLVPTMGALHAGHRSLVRRAVAECDRTVVSIFVNPAQFGPGDDFDRYPRRLDDDIEAIREEGADAVFAPTAAGMYPTGFATTVGVGGSVAEGLEGAHRPAHFNGVALVVSKLFVAARPDRAYFGRKDAQQCAVVRRVAADLDTGVEVVLCPTVRDVDGLAMSSRNAFLGPADRQRALAIPLGIARAARLFEHGEGRARALRAVVFDALRSAQVEPDYVAVVDADAFCDVDSAVVGNEILVAAKIGTTRLIDQMRLGIDVAPVVVGAAGAPCNGS